MTSTTNGTLLDFNGVTDDFPREIFRFFVLRTGTSLGDFPISVFFGDEEGILELMEEIWSSVGLPPGVTQGRVWPVVFEVGVRFSLSELCLMRLDRRKRLLGPAASSVCDCPISHPEDEDRRFLVAVGSQLRVSGLAVRADDLFSMDMLLLLSKLALQEPDRVVSATVASAKADGSMEFIILESIGRIKFGRDRTASV